MGSTRTPMIPHRGSRADLSRRRKEAQLLMIEDSRIDEAIVLAGIREQVRIFGFDSVRGL
ncbi:hypothetical protein ACVII1_001319 [Bradyrhizobium elkanii]|jgi:hypothetical protein|uniref:Response regulatory domain-containing protein n=1 Tax=Bradyrhizobium elkanii TaxID=29448 RepID=A0ABV4F0X5_BRAEL